MIQVYTLDTVDLARADDTIVSNGGTNVILGGVGADDIQANLGSQNIILGDNGVVNLNNGSNNDIFSTQLALGGDDTITAGIDNADATSNVIIGGYGDDTITIGSGDNVVLGDNGYVARIGGTIGFGDIADVIQVYTLDTVDLPRANDTIVSNGGTNVILGGLGSDTICALGGSQNIILGDNGVVNLNNGSNNDIYSVACGGGTATTTCTNPLGGADTIVAGIDNANATSNIIIGGVGADQITLGSGDNVVLGDNGYISRIGGNIGFGTLADVIQVTTTDTADSTGAADTIVSNGGTNVILGGLGADTISALGGSQNIILGDNGVVNLNNGSNNDIYSVACGGGSATSTCDEPARWRRHDRGGHRQRERDEQHHHRRRRRGSDHAWLGRQRGARRQRLHLADRRQHRLRHARRRDPGRRRPTATETHGRPRHDRLERWHERDPGRRRRRLDRPRTAAATTSSSATTAS